MNINKNISILNVKTDASELAITLSDTKSFLKIDFNDDDQFITRLIKTASSQCETNINKTLVERTYVYSIYDQNKKTISLPYPPVKSISEIKVIKKDESYETLNNTDYYFDSVGEIVNIKKDFNNFYRLDIEYIAGMTTINDEIMHALLMHIARMYEDRSGFSAIPLASMNIYKKYRGVKL